MLSLQAKKKFGQNFLHSAAIQQRFASEAKKILQENADISTVIEVGPGMGAITQHLAYLDYPLTCYEIDPEAIEYLQKQDFTSKINLIHSDFLQLIQNPWSQHDYIFVSNLPFNVGSRILIELSFQAYTPPLVVVLQKEVIRKITKKIDFSLFGAWLDWIWDCKIITDIAPGNFSPPPKITSTLITANVRPIALLHRHRKKYFLILKQLVRYPSKTLHNNLKGLLSADQIKQLYMDLKLDSNTRLGWDNYKKVTQSVASLTE